MPSRGSPLSSVPLAAVIGVLLGAGAGIGGFTFVYAKGAAYLTNDPAACNQCHVMNPEYSGWLQSSHRAVAACNDCHTPHGHLAKYATKAMNGFRHSYAFTTGDFHEPIQIHCPELADHRRCMPEVSSRDRADDRCRASTRP